MNPKRISRGLTIAELLVVIVIIAVLVIFIVPAVNSAREAGRRASCLNKNRQIGLAFANYASTFGNRFPQSASVITEPGANKPSVGGWSFLVRLLPFMDLDKLYKTLPQDGDPEDTTNQAILAATNMQMNEFLCPSAPRGGFSRSSGSSHAVAVTNYKAMGASSRDSLIMVVDSTAKPPYGTMAPLSGNAPLHPDGAIFPG